MKKYLILFVVMTISLASMAVPARRGFHDYPQPDGSVISLTLAGDESMHWYEDAAGNVYYQESEGTFTPATVTRTEQRARRMAAAQRRVKADVGTEPYPAPRGLLILANFSDVKFKDTNDYEVMDSLINAVNCQVNGGYGSAAQYFRDQSDGQYAPVFDVYGPVDLSQKQNYYGQNVGSGDDAADKYATDAVIEACILANEQYENLDFANYDWNDDGYVDFVYVIYAGKGEADGGASYTIWPHNYSIQMVIQYKGQGLYSTYSKSDTKIDGKYLDNYAMSQEIDGQTGSRAGNGTFCHEFGHVIGLPDFYDTSYGSNYSSQLTPNEWDVMDGGAYNGNGHCPPNYSAWEKYFMGWLTPENLGSNGAELTLYPNGTDQHNVYQINTSGQLESATKEGLNYYIECRQKTGWDTHIPAAGMLIWKVNFSSSAWSGNTANNTANNPKYTLVIPSGTKIGASYGTKNVWPYGSKDSWEGVSGKPLKNIAKSGNNITLTYIEASAPPQDPTVPSAADLTDIGDVTTDVVLCLKFDEEVCNEVVLVGTYNGWNVDNVAELIRFEEVTGFDGWYAAAFPWTSDAAGKAVQLKTDGSFDWEYQTGDQDAWIYKGGKEATIQAGYGGESNVYYSEAGAYIYEIAYWKKHNTPCEAKASHKYTFVLFDPVCESNPEFVPAISGGFNSWTVLPMARTTYAEKEAWTCTVEAEEGSEYKFLEATLGWDNEFIYYNEGSDKWTTFGNSTFPAADNDPTIVYDYSDTEKYAYLLCGHVDEGPTTCAEAAEAALSVSANNELYNNGAVYTIQGYVTGIKTAWSSQYKNISFWMADEKDGGEVLQAYRAACETEADAPQVGDKVAVTGSLTKYNSIPEFAAGCTFIIVEHEEPVVPELIEGNYTVQYYDDADKQLYTEVVTLHVPVAPTIEGFTFIGWQTVQSFISEAIQIEAVYEYTGPEGLAPTEVEVPGNDARKLIRDGNVYILKGEKIYTTTGQAVK